jgi:hypothetical protein
MYSTPFIGMAQPTFEVWIFIFHGNEGDIKWFVANSNFLWDITQIFKTLNLFLKVNFDVSFYSSCFFNIKFFL